MTAAQDSTTKTTTRAYLAAARAIGMLPDVRGTGLIGELFYRSVVADALRRDPGTVRPDVVSIQMRRGHTMQAPATSLQTWLALTTRRYDDVVVAALDPLITPGGMVLDIGACLGFLTVPLAGIATGRDARVVAVEPVPSNQQFLMNNVGINGLSGAVYLWPVALGTASGWTDVCVEAGGAGNAALSTTWRRANVSGTLDGRRPLQVRTASLDDLATEVPAVADRRCSLVKIDVEGFELEVLSGGREFVRRNRPIIYAEFEADFLEDRGESPQMLVDWLVEHSYRAYEVRARRPSRLTSRHCLVVSPADLNSWPRKVWALMLTPEERPASTLGLPHSLVQVT